LIKNQPPFILPIGKKLGICDNKRLKRRAGMKSGGKIRGHRKSGDTILVFRLQLRIIQKNLYGVPGFM
jgi:hypothetical protein